MADWLEFVRFDVIFVLIALSIIISSALRNQRLVARNLVCLIFAVAIVGLPVIFDYANVSTLLVGILDKYALGYAEVIFKVGDPVALRYFLVVVVFIVLVLIVHGILVGLCKLIGGADKKKMRKQSSYVTSHKPVWGIICGIVKSVVVIYLLFIVISFAAEVVNIDLSKDYSIEFLRSIDPVVGKIKELLGGLL